MKTTFVTSPKPAGSSDECHTWIGSKKKGLPGATATKRFTTLTHLGVKEKQKYDFRIRESNPALLGESEIS
jgi:hypothetical protein